MARVGEKLFLLLGAAEHGPDGPFGQEIHQQKHRQIGHRRHRGGNQQRIDGRAAVRLKVEEHHRGVFAVFHGPVAVIAAETVFPLLLHRLHIKLCRLRLGYGGDPLHFHIGDGGTVAVYHKKRVKKGVSSV